MKRKFTVTASREAKLRKALSHKGIKSARNRDVRRKRPVTAEVVDDFDDWYERCWSVYLDKIRETYPNLEVDQNTHNYQGYTRLYYDGYPEFEDYEFDDYDEFEDALYNGEFADSSFDEEEVYEHMYEAWSANNLDYITRDPFKDYRILDDY